MEEERENAAAETGAGEVRAEGPREEIRQEDPEQTGQEAREAEKWEALAEEIRSRWEQQAEAARQLFPGLELGREMENPRFQALLLGGAGVEDAYFAAHREEILPALLAYTAKTVEEKLAGALRAGGGRPGENGAGGQSAAAPRLDARRMDRAEFQALCRKIAAGERVSMG